MRYPSPILAFAQCLLPVYRMAFWALWHCRHARPPDAFLPV